MEKRNIKALTEALETLYEFYDTVQIFVSKHSDSEKDETFGHAVGRGNTFARLAQAKLWVDEKEAHIIDAGFNQEEEDEDENPIV